MANRLVAASSLYLSQHADNPVDWYAWGEEAFARARAEDKPVFLSIGYSACHWCHVMARESFSSVAVAAILNEHFICIKVDREERPDVDAAYMEAVSVMTGHGGWPLSVFLTPDGTPFYGGTYYPPAPRSGMPGFPQILAAVVDAWTNRRREVLQGGRRLAAAVARSARWSEAATGDGPGAEAVDAAVAALASGADRLHGGFGAAPKFPQAPALAFLLGRHARRPGGDQGALEVALAALGGMIRGGIHDQLAGGFHRYSVDEAWTVPHFEKMLTDNAQLAWLCAAAWQISGVERFRQVAGSTMDFLVEDLRGSHGAFLAAIDADSEGEEGAYYLWSTSEIDAALDPEAAAVARLWYGVTPAGNFEGRNVLTARADAEAAATLGLSEEAFRAAGRRARMALLAARRRRPAPRVDPKVVVSWNGLAIDAAARCGVALQRPDLVAVAVGAADFVRREARVDGHLAHSWAAGGAEVPAFLEDKAAMALACFSLYDATLDGSWLEWAEELVDAFLEAHADGPGALARATAKHGALFVRQKELVDGPVASGNAQAAAALLRMAALKGEVALEDRAQHILRAAGGLAAQAPGALGGLMQALDTLLVGSLEVVVVGAASDPGTAALIRAAQGVFLPDATRVVAGDGWQYPPTPLVEGRLAGGAPAAYVCRRGACELPAHSPEGLLAQLPAPAAPESDVPLAPDPTRGSRRGSPGLR